MTSFGVTGRVVQFTGGPQPFVIEGSTYHLISASVGGPQREGSASRYLELLYTTPHDDGSARAAAFSNTRAIVHRRLYDMLRICNPYIRSFLTAAERYRQLPPAEQRRPYSISIQSNAPVPPGQHPGRYGGVVASEVAALIPTPGEGRLDACSPEATRHILIEVRPGGPSDREQRQGEANRGGGADERRCTTQRICEWHEATDPMTSPLLFPHGEPGWKAELPRAGGPPNRVRTTVTRREHAAFRMQARDKQRDVDRELSHPTTSRQWIPNIYAHQTLQRGGRLYQQWLCSQYARIEASNLKYQEMNQQALRRTYLQGALDAIDSGDASGSTIGQRVLLSPSFVSGPRYMNQHYNDAMAIVRKYDNPSYFCTATASSEWRAVQEECRRLGVKPVDAPDVVARVWRMKQREILLDLTKRNVLGQHVAHVWVVEFQVKRHVLLATFLFMSPFPITNFRLFCQQILVSVADLAPTNSILVTFQIFPPLHS